MVVLKTEGRDVELSGRTLAIMLELAEMQKEINSWPHNLMVIFNCAGKKVRPEIRKYGKEVAESKSL